jgi:Flp pilus assembly protein TadD
MAFSLVLLGAGAFLRGFYWPVEYWSAVMLVLFCGALAFAVSPDLRERAFRLTVPKLAASAMFGILVLGIVKPVSTYHALQAVLFWASVFVVYLVWSGLRLSEAHIEAVVAGLVLVGATLSTAGLAVYTGLYNYERWMVGNRLAAGFEYPNVVANLFLVTLLLALHSLLHSRSSVARFFYGMAALQGLIALFLTQSRGGWLTAVVCVGLMLAVNVRRMPILTVLSTAWLAGLGLLSVYTLMRWESWQGFFICVGLSLIAGLVASLQARISSLRLPMAAIGGIGLIALTAVSVAIYVLWGRLAAQLQGILARFSPEIMLQDGRLVFFQDAWRIFLQGPLVGHGGGAWRALYHRVQSFLYGTARLHSDPFEILLEVGLIGFVAYMCFVAWPMIRAWRMQNVHHKALAITALAFAGHSFIEAFLGFPVFYYWLALVLGILSADMPAVSVAAPHRAARVASVGRRLVPLVLVGMAVFAGVFWLAEVEDVWNIRPAGRRGDVTAVREGLERALRLNPTSIERQMSYINMLWQETPQPRQLLHALLSAHRHSPHDPRISNLLGHYYLGRREFATATVHFEEARRQQPMNIQNYEALALAHLFAAVDAAGRSADSESSLVRLDEVHASVQAIIARTNPAWLALSHIPFAETPVLRATHGARLVMRGEVAQAVAVLSEPHLLADANSKETALVWLVRALQLSGRHDEAQARLAGVQGNESIKSHLALVTAATKQGN